MEDLNNIDDADSEYYSDPLVLSPNHDDNNNIDPDLIVPETPMTEEREQKKELIICNGNECTLLITECSLPCFDHNGNFYCPPCWYKSATAELEKLQEEMILAKQNVHFARNSLSLFINATPQPPTSNRVEAVAEQCGGGANVKNQEFVGGALDENQEECNVEGGNVVSTVNADNEKNGNGNFGAEVSEKEILSEKRTRSGKAKQAQSQPSKSTEPTVPERNEDLDASDEDFDLLDRVFGPPQREDTEMENEKQKHLKGNLGHESSNTHQRCAGKSDPFTRFQYKKLVVQQKDVELQDEFSFEESASSEEAALNGDKPEIVSGKSARHYRLVKRSTNPAFPGSKRKGLPWTYEEEEMLMEGVRIYSLRGNKNLPWKSILVHGSQVFNESRTPSDLKDKWRRMVKHASRAK